MIGTPGVWDIGLLRDLSSFNRSILLVSEVRYSFATHLSLAPNKKLQHAGGRWASIFGFKRCSKCSVFHRWMRENEGIFFFFHDRESYSVGLPGELRRRNVIMWGKRLTLRHHDAISSHLHFDLMHLNGAIYFIFFSLCNASFNISCK